MTTAFFNFNDLNTYANAAALTAVVTASLPNGSYAEVTDLGVFQLVKQSNATVDSSTVIAADVSGTTWNKSLFSHLQLNSDAEIDGSQIASFSSVSLSPGTAGAPSLNFSDNTTTGLYEASSDVFGWAVNGVSIGTMSATTDTFLGNGVYGASGTAGAVTSYPAGATSGYLKLAGVANSGNYAITLSNASMGQATTVSISDPGASTGYLNTSSVNASTTPVGAFITKDVSLGQAALASSGHVAIQTGSGAMQFKVRDIFVNYSASGLSGGGGNRLITITDGTTIWNNAGITAALLGTPVNTVLGGSGNPVAGTVAQNTSSAAGASIYAVYSGGTTDYTAGAVVITVKLERVA